MKNTLYLTKVLLLNIFSNFSLSSNKKQSAHRRKLKLLGAALLVIILAFSLVAIGYAGYEMGELFKAANAVEDAINSLIPMMGIMVVYFSIFGIISTFFLSNDIETLLSLPFKPKEIIVAKFISSIVTVYFIELMMFIPMILGIGIGAGVHFVFYINLVLVTIFFPLIPIALLGIVITSLMRYTALNRIKDKIQYVIMVFIIVFAVGIEIFSMSMGETTQDMTNSILSQDNTLANIMFFTYPASYALSNPDPLIAMLWMLLFIATSILSVYLFALIGEKTYIKAILGKPQIKINKEEKQKLEIKNSNKTSCFMEIVKTEFRTILRSPSFNINLLLSVFIVPILLVISMIFSIKESTELENLTQMIEALKMVFDFESGYFYSFVFAALVLFSAFSMISCTAISRDGKYAYFYKFVPVDSMTIIHSKMFLGVVLALIPQIVFLIVLVVFNVIEVIIMLLILVPLIFVNIFMNYVGIIIDLYSPKLDWENETIAVKQNMNSLFYMFADVVVTILVVLFGILLYKHTDLSQYLVAVIFTLIFGIGCVIIYKLLKSKGNRVFNNIG